MIKLNKIGSDPEAFLFAGGNPVSAIGLVPGSKEEPFKISEHESVQVDNVAIEFNIKPSETPEEFMESLGRCYAWSVDHLSKIDPRLQFVFTPSVEFDKQSLKSKAARTFGCDPDFNAWTGGVNRPPSPGGLLRSCGGHIHLGLDMDFSFDEKRLIRLMDKYVGSYVSYICPDKRRMELYGKAGAFRMKDYGVEYRTPSNTWLKDEGYITEVFKRCHQAVDAYNNGEDAETFVREIIDSAEKEQIKELVSI